MNQESIQTLNACLWELGWTWQHPRVQGYLEIVANRLKVLQFNKIEDIPEFYMQKLIKLLKLYYDCDKLLKMMAKTWEDADIKLIISSYSYIDKMPVKGYEELYKFLDYTWYNEYGF